MEKKIVGLAPLGGPGARVLILGSMPGECSLQMGQYYAHPRNQFWRILGEIFKVGTFRNYSVKKIFLKRRHLAVWDVVKSCHRHRSADLSICKVVANEIPVFLKRHPKIRHVLLNGRIAERYFLKMFAGAVSLPCSYVPSSSPAHAGLSFAVKVRLWKKALTRIGVL
jgi:double-stranded uracil-DNA glycosylase